MEYLNIFFIDFLAVKSQSLSQPMWYWDSSQI